MVTREKQAAGQRRLAIYGRLYWLPIIASVFWSVTLLVLLIFWLATGRPVYETQDGYVAFISDIGAKEPKPLFVLGTIIASTCFVAILASLHHLQRPRSPDETGPRLLPHTSRATRILSGFAVGASFFGGLALILLAGFDTARYIRLHRFFLGMFMLNVFFSALFTIIQFTLVARTYKRRQAKEGIPKVDESDLKWIRKSAMMKLYIGFTLLALAVIFASVLGTADRPDPLHWDVAAVIEWVIGFFFSGYLASFWYDLKRVRRRSHDMDSSSTP